ncbi:MAG: OmpA family protein [Verrucomicrobiae bacterium]|nr:OmpA family protein [Verrucomicrobiae bacterium]
MSAKKPSPVASLIVLVLVVLLLGGIGGGGFWAYNKWMKKSDKGETPPPSTPPVAKTDEVTEPDETGIVVIDEPSGTVAIDEPTDTDTPPPPVVVDIDTPPTTVDIDPAPATDTPPPPPPAKVDVKPAAEVIENVAELPKRAETPGMVGYATDSPEGQGLIADALRRVDEAPDKTEKEKERAKKILREAKKISKVATVYFPHEGNNVATAEVARLAEALNQPDVRGMTRNNKAICFALGFADKTGSAAYNKALSMKRAQSVISELEKKGLKLSTTAIAIGPSELVDKENQGKNRAAEVWIVIP